MQRILLALLPLALAACAPAPVVVNVASATQPGVVCETEAATGTNFPKKRCRTEAQRAEDQAQVLDMKDKIRGGVDELKGR